MHSSPLKAENREVLRATWFHSDPRMLSFFVMGKTHSKSLQKKIDKESEMYGDIIQGNFVDAYHNLTYKHALVMKWFNTHCTDVKFLVKMDDDVFMNVPAVFDYLQEIENENHAILGNFIPPEKTKRSGKWKTTFNQWKDDDYPEYCVGPSIIYSNEYIRQAYPRTFTTHFLWLDDVFFTAFIRIQFLMKITPINERILATPDFDAFLHNESYIPAEMPFLFTDVDCYPDSQLEFWNKMKQNSLG